MTAATTSTHRTFIQDDSTVNIPNTPSNTNDKQQLIQYIRNNIIGYNTLLTTPFGQRTSLYCDWTSSGRAVQFIEQYIQTEILPIYSNTHTNTNYCSMQIQLLRNEARQMIGQYCNCSRDDIVLFVGTGSTAAINLFVHIQNIQSLYLQYNEQCKQYSDSTTIPDTVQQLRPIVFVGPYEHHSNLLPWREADCEIIELTESIDGGIDITILKQTLEQYSAYKYKYAAVSVCSNVTGILTDTLQLQSIFNQHNVICCYDYATAAPYIDIDMNPISTHDDSKQYHKHCIVLSTHKMLGGVQTPGILIVKKSLLINNKPLHAGGGTVFYVTNDSHRYIENYAELYEGGTPAIVESIRAGLVFQLKAQIGTQYIHDIEQQYLTTALQRLKSINNLILLGNSNTVNRIPILSFMIYCPELQQLLHSGYISVLLNDIFGIQSRAGCMCAGPYSHTLLGINKDIAQKFESCLLHKQELLRPSFVRINLHYTHTETQIEYILNAVQWLCEHAYKLLPLYHYNVETGEWRHTSYKNKLIARRWLSNITYHNNTMQYPSNNNTCNNTDYTQYMYDADTIVQNALQSYSTLTLAHNEHDFTAESNKLRWFILPYEVLQYSKTHTVVHTTRQYSIQPPSHTHLFTPNNNIDDNIVPVVNTATDNNAIDTAINSPKRKPVTDAVQQSTKKNKQSNGTTQPVICRNCYHTHMPTDSHNIKPTTECLTCQCITYQPITHATEYSKLAHKTLINIKSATGKAIKDYSMIKQGDRVLIGVSGGKDSLTLVHTLLALQKRSPVKFDIGCCTVDPQTPEYNPRPLIEYFKSLNIPYYYESHPILELAKSHMSAKRVSICSFCSRMKRGILYSCCRRNNYNVLALGQHCDDLCESLFMSLFHNGSIRTMKANYHVAAGDIRIIRPFIYVRERLTRDYSVYAQLPVINENCPACFEDPKERQRIKLLLAKQETIHPTIYSSLQQAMKPLMSAENDAYLATMENKLCKQGDCSMDADTVEVDESVLDIKQFL